MFCIILGSVTSVTPRFEGWHGARPRPPPPATSDREQQPLAYTSDPAALRAMVGDADWIVMVDFHHPRNRQLELLLESGPQRYEEMLSGEGLGVLRVVGE